MMTSTESDIATKKVNETSKKSSPLKVVSPIIKKYSGKRQIVVKKKLKFPRRGRRSKSKDINQKKPSLKTILPKTNAGDIVIVESELLPCALNIHNKRRREEAENNTTEILKTVISSSEKLPKYNVDRDPSVRSNKSKISSCIKRKKYLKNIEATFTLLEPETEDLKEKREQAFAENYLRRVQQTLKGKDDILYRQFIDLICDFQKQGLSVSDLYKKVKLMFSNHADLSEDFIAFLTPSQAVESELFQEHWLFTIMTDFLNALDIYFSKSPQQVKKIHSILETLSLKQNLTAEDVKNAILPLLKGNMVLQDYFLKLLPQTAPPNNFLMDFEEVDYPELYSDASEDEAHFETVKLPEVEDVFGGDLCPCNCHSSDNDKFKTKTVHCTSCSVKFINGKIFIQQGKLLRPAKVTFDDHDAAYHRGRLIPKFYPNRGRKKTKINIFKEHLSPTKTCYISSDEFKSDIEDEERLKSKLGLCKSPRIVNKKISSPKNFDKNLWRSTFSDMKSDYMDSENKLTANKIIPDASLKRTESSITNFERADDACDFTQNSETTCDVTKNELGVISMGLDLPQIDLEDEAVPNSKMVQSLQLPEGEKGSVFESKMLVQSPVLIKKEGSKSPPVISIPDSANPSMFSSGKPILSFLESWENSKEPVLLISDTSNGVKFESKTEILSNGSDTGKNNAVNNVKEEKKGDTSKCPWKIEEDRIILQTLQVEENCEETFKKINDKIPTRSLKDIKKRFATLMNILYKMKSKTKISEDVPAKS